MRHSAASCGSRPARRRSATTRSEEHTYEFQSPCNLVCRLLLEKKNTHPFEAAIQGRYNYAVRREKELMGSAQRFADFSIFFFNDTATTEIYTLSLHDALPI